MTTLAAPDLEESARHARALALCLPAPLVPLFDTSFIHSSKLYDEFVYRLTLRVFRDAGLEPATRTPGTADEIAARAALELGRSSVPVAWILRYLAARHALEMEPAGPAPRFRLIGPVPALEPAPLREAQQRHDPSWLPSYALAETAAADYPAFLRGQATGEEILFSPGRFRLWIDYFSNDNRLYAVNNRVGAIAVAEWLPRRGGVVLELGGGLGSAATALLERFAEDGRLDAIREYRFTELVPLFLRRGQRVLEARSSGPPLVTFGSLDMNRPFAEQGAPPGSLSLVYAVNTLHVAHDLAFTLGEVLRALEPGGRLVISECVRLRPGQPIYVELVFNLMETFRSARLDPVYRPNGGFLTPEQWARAMEAAGFADVRFIPDVVRLREQFPDFHLAAIGATRPA